MEHTEMIALLKSQMHMTYAERNEIAVHMNALSERLHQQEADIEKLVQERGTMRASSPTMEWISVEDERTPKEHNELCLVFREDGIISLAVHYEGSDRNYWSYGDVTHWMSLPDPPKPKGPTFKDVFLEKFPKADIEDGDDGNSLVCRNAVFFGRALCSQFPICSECWNQLYFEEEGEAE